MAIPSPTREPMIERPSPNQDARSDGAAIDMLILHYTGMPTGEAALERLCDASARVSAHYMVEEDGRVFRLVPEERRAWHAGVSSWRGEADINGRSLGIEIVNPGHEFGYRPFPEAQMVALEALCFELIGRHPIPPRHVLGHSDVAPARKEDPGELFDWPRLAAAGIGLWPRQSVVAGEVGLSLGSGDAGPPVAELQGALAGFGYGVPGHGAYDERTEAVVTAFQRHFRPRRVDGIADPETAQLAFAVSGLVT